MKTWQQCHHLVVVGLGITGLSVVNYVKRVAPHVDIKVIDTRSNPPGAEALPVGIDHRFGEWNMDWLLNADLVVTTPGVALATEQIQTVISAGIQVVGDIELFAQAVDKPVLAITGSNGKSTVTDLTGVLLRSTGLNVGVGGNIGTPALDLLDQGCDVYVLELSSFQLETTYNLALVAAAYLNLSEDHMDRYASFAHYGAAKQRIFRHAELAIVNREDRATYPSCQLSQKALKKTITFGLNDQEFGLIEHQGQRYLSVDQVPLVATQTLSMIGQHNYLNALVALALVSSLSLDLKSVIPALQTYSGLTHRCEVVVDNHGIKWINDSKATNVASTQAALSGLECDGQLYLLVGGEGKDADFSTLAPMLNALPVTLLCFGKDGPQLASLARDARVFTDMDQAVASIAGQLKGGDIVLLSPACASLDQYANFAERGRAFVRLAEHYGK